LSTFLCIDSTSNWNEPTTSLPSIYKLKIFLHH